MAEQIAPGIFKLYIPLHGSPLQNLNSYLVRGQERNLLIDTGFNTPGCLGAMLSELELLGVAMTETDIFLTHMHADHSGLIAELASASTKIYMSAIDAVFLNSVSLSETQERQVRSYVSEGFPAEEAEVFMRRRAREGLGAVKPKDYSCLNDGDVLSYGGYDVTCILTPGHSPGHMCLYIEALKLMVLGDHVLFTITPNIVRWPNFDNALKQYLDSLKKIGAYDIAVALPAHRTVVGTVAERVASITGHHIERLREVTDIIGSCPGLTAYDIAGRMHWDIQSDSWRDFPPTQKWFAVGEALAHIDSLLADGSIRFENKNGIRQYYSVSHRQP